MKQPNKPLLAFDIDTGGSDAFSPPNERGTPERNLLMAILERAILDYVGNDEKEIEQSTTWIFDDLEDPRPTQFSFPWLCQQLDLDTKSIAATIKAMPKRGSRRVAPWYFDKNTGQKGELQKAG